MTTINHEEVNLIMEKKSTKIAYFVALGIFVVLLAISLINSRQKEVQA